MRVLLPVLCFLLTLSAAANDSTYVLKRLSPVPIRVNGQSDVKLDLNGSWYFNPASKDLSLTDQNDFSNWKKIEVPGEWVMQGFKVAKNHWAVYSRTFKVPADWKRSRVKLRCDGVYSECVVFINGHQIGAHLGGFTPFEFDVTDFARPGAKSVITIKVKNESLADALASGSQYAVHALGGITRKIYLMQMPQLNFSMFHVQTDFDTSYENGRLKTQLEIVNESPEKVQQAAVLFELEDPITKKVVLKRKIDVTDLLKGQRTVNKVFEFAIDKPLKWDPEHPHLYNYRLTLENGKRSEMVQRKIGFRKIEIRGNKIYVNNRAVKLRGACRHEIDPLRGRSLTRDEWVKDVLLFRSENVNYIRTSHYPPPEEFIKACDSLGMFVECEAPFCWADQTRVPADKYREAILDQTADMVNFFRSNVSIIDWSIANESQGAYKDYFHQSAALVKRLDPTRPRIYNQYGPEIDNKELELANFHYPGPEGPSKYRNNDRPILFNEYAHLNAYNRFELITDPGIRDAWGMGFKNMWEAMYSSPAIAGGCIWAGIDDTFILPGDTVVGYGTWGPIDDWRRLKPEYWHVKKSYSPVKIKLAGNFSNGSVPLIIDNRLLFSNMDECKIRWRAGKFSGAISPSIAPGAQQLISLRIDGRLSAEDTLFIDVFDPRQVLIDQYAYQVVPRVSEMEAIAKEPGKIKYLKTDTAVQATIGENVIKVNKEDGVLTISNATAKQITMKLGALMILPLNGQGNGTQMTGKAQVFDPFTPTASHRVIGDIKFNCLPTKFVITIADSYDEAAGFIHYAFAADNNIEIQYHYKIKKAVNPRQWGWVASLSNDFNKISWKRKGLWSYYPKGHIGRLSGSADATSVSPITGPAGPVKRPSWNWAEDRTELGTNDFRSTKMHITEGAVIGKYNTLKVVSDGSQSMRTWKEQGRTRLLIAGYSNLGAEGFFRGHAARFDKPLKKGDVIENTIRLQLK